MAPTRVVVGLAAAIFVGCGLQQPTIPTHADLQQHRARQIAEIENDSQWVVECRTNDVRATTDCFARRRGHTVSELERPFPEMLRVSFFNGVGPVVQAGANTFPGKDPTVRVDSNAPIRDMKSRELIEQMKRGEVLRGEYYTWPDRVPKQMIVRLDGFGEAYDDLLRRVAAAK